MSKTEYNANKTIKFPKFIIFAAIVLLLANKCEPETKVKQEFRTLETQESEYEPGMTICAEPIPDSKL